jgi:hypothetical protein
MSLLSRAADRVLGRRMMLPPELEADALPPGVVLREGRLIPAIGGFLSRLGGPASAVTLRNTIVVHPDARLTLRLLAHELAHVRQWDEDALFPLRYTAETVRHGYRSNRYEREAREAELA